MNRNFALSLVIAAAAGSAFAQEITAEPARFQPSATRAEVQAELKAARDAVAAVGGELGPSAQNFTRGERVANNRLAGQPRSPQ